jgi:hypothetical protein
VALPDFIVQELAGHNTNNASGASTGEDPRQKQGILHGNAATVCAFPAKYASLERLLHGPSRYFIESR